MEKTGQLPLTESRHMACCSGGNLGGPNFHFDCQLNLTDSSYRLLFNFDVKWQRLYFDELEVKDTCHLNQTVP